MQEAVHVGRAVEAIGSRHLDGDQPVQLLVPGRRSTLRKLPHPAAGRRRTGRSASEIPTAVVKTKATIKSRWSGKRPAVFSGGRPLLLRRPRQRSSAASSIVKSAVFWGSATSRTQSSMRGPRPCFRSPSNRLQISSARPRASVPVALSAGLFSCPAAPVRLSLPPGPFAPASDGLRKHRPSVPAGGIASSSRNSRGGFGESADQFGDVCSPRLDHPRDQLLRGGARMKRLPQYHS